MQQFNSFDALADHFARVTARLPGVIATELEHAGSHIADTAKGKLGEYQPGAGPFQAWPELAVATLANKRRQEATGGAESPELVTGKHLFATIAHKVEGHAAHIGSDDPVAEYQELGTNRIPARSFLGSSLFEEGPKLAADFGRRIDRLIGRGL